MNCVNSRQGCGGCTGLEKPYSALLEEKQAKVESLLGKFGTVKTILPAKEPTHYRCKVVASFYNRRDGKLGCGLYAQGTHNIIPSADCALENETAAHVVQAVCRAAAQCKYKAYDEDRHQGLLRHVLVRVGAVSGQIMVVLVTAQPMLPGSKNFVNALRKLCPAITTVVQNVNQKESSAVLGTLCKTLFGPGMIEDTLCGCRFLISPLSFYQVNPRQTEKLYREAIRAAKLTDGCTVLDAYCGTGTIGLVAAKSGAGHVLGVESNRDAVGDAVKNARRNKIANARFVAGDAGKFMTELARSGEKAPDVVFMDPPRAGSDEAFLTSLLALSPRRIVYVSCNPETQARDLQTLAGKYKVESIQPVDMFPYTEHVECVVGLLRV